MIENLKGMYAFSIEHPLLMIGVIAVCVFCAGLAYLTLWITKFNSVFPHIVAYLTLLLYTKFYLDIAMWVIKLFK